MTRPWARDFHSTMSLPSPSRPTSARPVREAGARRPWASWGRSRPADTMPRPTSSGCVRPQQIRTIVEDPDVAGRLCRRRRSAASDSASTTGYYAVFNRTTSNWSMAAAPIPRSPPPASGRPSGVRLAARLRHRFDAMTGALSRIDIRGRGECADRCLAEAHARISGRRGGISQPVHHHRPGSPWGWRTWSWQSSSTWTDHGCIEHLPHTRRARNRADGRGAGAWVTFVADVADFTLFPPCNSWYLGSTSRGSAGCYSRARLPSTSSSANGWRRRATRALPLI